MKKRKPLKRTKTNGYSIRKQKPTLHKPENAPPNNPNFPPSHTKENDNSASTAGPARKRMASELLGGPDWMKERIRLLPTYSIRLETGALSDRLDACAQVRLMLTPSMCDPPIPPLQQVFCADIPRKLLALLCVDENYVTSPESDKRTILEMKIECATAILLVLLSRNPLYIQRTLDMRVVELSILALKSSIAAAAATKERSAENEELQRVLLWCLGLISTYSPQLREYVLREGCLDVVAGILEGKPQSLDLYRQCVWSLRALCIVPENGHAIGFSTVWTTLHLVKLVLTQSKDMYALRDASATLLGISGTGEINNVSIIEAGLLPAIVAHLNNSNTLIQSCMLEVIGNMVVCSDGDDIVQAVIDAQALPALTALFSCPERELAAESLWVISNIAAGSDAQIEAVLKSGALSLVISIILSTHEVYRVKKEAGFVLANAVLCSKSRLLYERSKSLPHFIPALEVLLKLPSPDVLAVCLDCLIRVCKVMREMPVFREIRQSRIPQIVLDIQVASKVDLITDKTSKLLDKYFNDDADADDYDYDEDDDGEDEMNVESYSGSSSSSYNSSNGDNSSKDDKKFFSVSAHT